MTTFVLLSSITHVKAAVLPPEYSPYLEEGIKPYLEDPCPVKPCGLRTKDCDCEDCRVGHACRLPRSFQWCEHVAALHDKYAGEDFILTAQEAAVVLAAWFPRFYRESPRPPRAEFRVTPEQELNVFAVRAMILRTDDRTQYALRHPHDIKPEHATCLEQMAMPGKERGEIRTTAENIAILEAAKAAKRHKGSFDKLAERAVKETGAYGRAMQRDFEQRMKNYEEECRRRSEAMFLSVAKEKRRCLPRRQSHG